MNLHSIQTKFSMNTSRLHLYINWRMHMTSVKITSTHINPFLKISHTSILCSLSVSLARARSFSLSFTEKASFICTSRCNCIWIKFTDKNNVYNVWALQWIIYLSYIEMDSRVTGFYSSFVKAVGLLLLRSRLITIFCCSVSTNLGVEYNYINFPSNLGAHRLSSIFFLYFPLLYTPFCSDASLRGIVSCMHVITTIRSACMLPRNTATRRRKCYLLKQRGLCADLDEHACAMHH